MDYKEFIESRRNKQVDEKKSQIHHIVPRCIGGKNEKDNLITLSWEDHWIAHQLLAQENPENKHLKKAASYTLSGWLAKCEALAEKRGHIEHKYNEETSLIFTINKLDCKPDTQIIIYDVDENVYIASFTYDDYLYDECPRVCNKYWDGKVTRESFYEYNGIENYELRVKRRRKD